MKKLVAAMGLLLFLIPRPAAAHPMGNFSINVHVGIDFQETQVAATLIVDMAEIPTFQEKPLIDGSGDGRISPAESSNYAIEACSHHRAAVEIFVDGAPVDLKSEGATVDFVPGAANLDILQLTCGYLLPLSGQPSGELVVSNKVYIDRVGWREMTATATGFAIETDLPVASPSLQLTQFPQGPVENRSNATIAYRREPGAVLAAPARTLVERIGTNLEFGWLALFSAAGLGIAHALAPGHGKTLMAAYLVGRRGRFRQAVGLGLAVAVSHTLGVAILGLITVMTTSRFEPERIYPWLSIASAVVVTAIGAAMLIRALLMQSRGHGHGHDHSHEHGVEHGHPHGHGDHAHHHSHHEQPARTLGWRSLAALGLAGGLVPSASAVVLLLGAVSQGDPWFGMGLVAAFGSGMALALVAAGIGAVWAVGLGSRLVHHEHWRQRFERIVPAVAGGTVTVVGLVLLVQAAKAWA